MDKILINFVETLLMKKYKKIIKKTNKYSLGFSHWGCDTYSSTVNRYKIILIFIVLLIVVPANNISCYAQQTKAVTLSSLNCSENDVILFDYKDYYGEDHPTFLLNEKKDIFIFPDSVILVRFSNNINGHFVYLKRGDSLAVCYNTKNTIKYKFYGSVNNEVAFFSSLEGAGL